MLLTILIWFLLLVLGVSVFKKSIASFKKSWATAKKDISEAKDSLKKG